METMQRPRSASEAIASMHPTTTGTHAVHSVAQFKATRPNPTAHQSGGITTGDRLFLQPTSKLASDSGMVVSLGKQTRSSLFDITP